MKFASRVLACALLAGAVAGCASHLPSEFKSPPNSARPWTWWHWVSGRVSREGITADLEAMKRIGVGGVEVFSVSQGPQGDAPVLYMSPEWRDLMKFAISEADRLGLVMVMHNCEGWSQTGGPWVKPESSMQKVVWTETRITGGKPVDLSLRDPEKVQGYYKDIAVLAFPSVKGDEVSMPSLGAKVKLGNGENGAKLIDGDAQSAVTIKPARKNDPAEVLVTFDKPTIIGVVTIYPVPVQTKGEVQISPDGKAFHKAGTFSATSRAKESQVITFAPQSVKAVRLRVPKPAEGGWKIGEIDVSGSRLPDYVARSGLAAKVNMAALPSNLEAGMVIPAGRILDLTSKVDGSGKLAWDAPAGEWTIVRMGQTSTGMMNYPAMDQTRGLEVDKLSRTAVESHFQNSVGVVAGDSPAQMGKGLKYVLLDSWEAGCQNWTPLMRQEFKSRCGYDPQPWLPTLTGRYVSSPDQTERFLWDYRRTIADLLAENHFGLIQKLSHQQRLKVTGETVGINMPTIADELQCKGRTEIPMGEFWVDREPRDGDPKEAASAAHIYGQNIASAEAYTARPDAAGWRNDPFSLKAQGDRMYCLGINRFVFHRYAHQPYEGKFPGVTMGPWGINFERTNTWWNQASAWMQYLARCEHMLQRGRFVADVCYYYGEGAPNTVQIESLTPKPVKGHDYDVCNREILLRMNVQDGQLALPSGMRYRTLVLPNTDRMTPAVAAKIKELVGAGATIVGPKPTQSPSMTNYPDCDAQVKQIGDEVWADCDGTQVTEHQFGAGQVLCGKGLEEVLNIPRDFESKNDGIEYIHRLDDDTDIYFVSNQKNVGQIAECTFRANGKTPELWWPDTGRTEPAAVWTKDDQGRVTLPISLDPSGSVFVVFHKKNDASPLAEVTLDGKSIFESPTIKTPPGDLKIVKADYGAVETGGKHRDVTAKVAAAVKDGVLDIQATNPQLGGDAAPLTEKQLRVEYTYNGQPGVTAVLEGKAVRIPGNGEPAPLPQVAELRDGGVTLLAWKAGHYEVKRQGGASQSIDVNNPAPIAIEGPWMLHFQPGRLAPESITFDHLISWTQSDQDGVKYFSGTATYTKELDLPSELVGPSHVVSLDLGDVKNLAEVKLNGKELGILWKPPFRVDLTRALRAGKNQLEIKVTNLWPNRLIGDQFLPEDHRVTWTTYNPYKKDSPLLKSGLIGPVTLTAGTIVHIR